MGQQPVVNRTEVHLQMAKRTVSYPVLIGECGCGAPIELVCSERAQTDEWVRMWNAGKPMDFKCNGCGENLRGVKSMLVMANIKPQAEQIRQQIVLAKR